MKFLKKGKNKKLVFEFLLCFGGAVVGSLLTICAFKFWPESTNERIKNLYNDEMSVFVSPTTVKKMIDNGDKSYILVDLRSATEYQKEHFVTAINIPAVSMNTQELVSAFAALPKDKEIIVHCYSAYCTLGRQVGQTLANHGIYVKELDAGWSELRYHWDLWNPGASVTEGEKYIVKGMATPSADPSGIPLPKPCTVGQFGC